MTRILVLLLMLGALFSSMMISVCAAETETPESAVDAVTFPEEYMQMLEQLPDAVRESLPPALFTSDPAAFEDALEDFLSPAALLSRLCELLFSENQIWLRLLVSVSGILLLRAVVQCLSNHLGGAISSTFGLLCRLCFSIVLIQNVYTTLESVTALFHSLQILTDAYLPLMGAMYAMGGNVATATVNQSTLVFSSALVSRLGGESVLPMFSLCLVLTLFGVFDSSIGSRMAQISGKIKKWYTTAISLTMLLLTAILAAQTTLTARADSLGFKTVRFVVSSNIPLVGGTVAEMLRTAASGLSWLRGLVGVGGIVLLLWLLLPALIQVILSRWVCMLGGDIAVWLGCGDEGRLLGEMGSLYGYLLAVVSVCSLTFFFSLVLLLRCGVAYGG